MDSFPGPISPTGVSHGTPTIEQIEQLDKDDLLKWIQQKKPKLLSGDDLKKFKETGVSGVAFLEIANNTEFFQKVSNISPMTCLELAGLARETAERRAAERRAAEREAAEREAAERRAAEREAAERRAAEREAAEREAAERETIGKQIDVEEAFPAGIKYAPPHSLVSTSGEGWKFQPHDELYKILANNVLKHYDCYKRNWIDKTYIPTYFYLGGAGTGKSRHGTEFASSVQEAIALHTQHHELAQRLKKAFVFHVSFGNATSLTDEMKHPWNAIGTRMLAQLLDQPLDVVDDRYVARPEAIFRLVAKAEIVDLYNDFTGILVVDGLQEALSKHVDDKDKDHVFYRLLAQISALSLMSRNLPGPENGTLRRAPFIMTCVTATYFRLVDAYLTDTHRRRVYLPLSRLGPPTWKDGRFASL